MMVEEVGVYVCMDGLTNHIANVHACALKVPVSYC